MKTILAAGLVAASCLGVFSRAAVADIIQFVVPLSGAQEFPGPGDPDGTGTAILFFDSVNNTVTWNITVFDILLPPTGAHIHQAAAGVAGPVRIDFSASLSGGPLVDTDVAGVLADPSGWYVNVHNSDFPAGAIRGQLNSDQIQAAAVPEPETAALLALALLALSTAAARRRRAVAR